MPSNEEHDMDNSEISGQHISDKQLMELAGKLGNRWQSLAIQHLDFKTYEVDNFISDGNSNQDKAFKMLQAWKCREKCPTVRSLIHILDKANIDVNAWLFLSNKDSNCNELRCKCCHKMDCQCKCEAIRGHIFSSPNTNGYNCSVKAVIVKANNAQKEGTDALENLFKEQFETNFDLLLKFRKIVNSVENKILNIVPGCVEIRLQILSYASLLDLSLLHVMGGSERTKQLPPLHQKLQDAVEEALSDVKITTEMLSFTNYFEGGSYRKAVEYFCRGFAVDDMLPIIKTPKRFQNVDYLCIDIKNEPQTTLSDLKREFMKQRQRKLHKLRRKVLKEKPMSKSDYNLIIKLIDNILNKPENKYGHKFSKGKDKELSGKEVKKIRQKTKYQEKKCGKSETSKILEENKITKPFKRLKISEFLVKRSQEFKTPGKKKRKIQDAKTVEMQQAEALRRETYNLEPSSTKIHTTDHQAKLETSLLYEPLLKKSKIIDYKNALTDEKVSQKLCPSTIKKTKRKPKEESIQTRKSNTKGKQEKSFEIVSLSKLRYKPKKCYGCRKNIGDVADLILKTQDVREYYGACRQKHLAHYESNVYFHFLEKCVRKKYGLINQHKFVVSNDISGCLSDAQRVMLGSMESTQDVGDVKLETKMRGIDLSDTELTECKKLSS
ncbi:uncharacterized protein LOC109920744 [Rhincodon typus]|uniref:uncharacterized protein LOC109920744 n=1 Tax=Rhincodon typus TaxID=259920 RepID=UPI0009A25BD4|nr:uncharacterized protein LOC109920744 [Rhincodon typus]